MNIHSPNTKTTNICVVGGAGYVGLITGLGLAELGHSVTCVDLDQHRIYSLKHGISPIFEEGANEALNRSLEAGRIIFSDDLENAVNASDIIFIAVGTPSLEDGAADLSQVIQVAEELEGYIDSYKVIVLKSTVPVGTVELIRGILSNTKLEGRDFDIVANPEFLREGKGLYDFFHPDRIVIGASSEKPLRIIRELYQPIIDGYPGIPSGQTNLEQSTPVPVVETDAATAQMIKYASNAFLATRISFMNEIASLCEAVGSDVVEVSLGMGYDVRIGHSYLQAGLGFGGPCLEKDLRALMKLSEGNGHEPQLLKAILNRNDQQVPDIISKLKRIIGPLLYQKKIAIFGLSFKAGTNDVRNSVALKVIDRLTQEGAYISAHDPLSIPEAKDLRSQLDYLDDPYEAVHDADALLLLTEWPMYKTMDYQNIMEKMRNPILVDARNLLDPETMRFMGYNYLSIGRP